MTTITFLRARPAQTVNQLTATTRRKEGTTALEVPSLTTGAVDAALAGGLLPISAGLTDVEPVAWVVTPTEAQEVSAAPWRITVIDQADRTETLAALARLQPAFLRTRRSQVAHAAALTSLPGLNTVVSVFVDTASEARAAVEAGAGDLVLRDWGDERIGELRDALAPFVLVERTALPLGTDLDEARRQLQGPAFTAWLNQTDGSGAARPRYRWAPGLDETPPMHRHRLSAEWVDDRWISGRPTSNVDSEIGEILRRSRQGMAPSRHEIEVLFRARGDQVDAIATTADHLRERAVGDTVSYVVNRNINYTNMCYFKCGFCAFSKGPKSLNLRGDPYLMGVPEIVTRAREAWERGATEVCLQGGIHPEFTGDFYVGVVEAIKAELPGMHIHGFTPLEVWQGAETLGIPVRAFLERLAAVGLGTLPGTAAEILDDSVREHLCPDKIRTAQWAEVMLTAADLGLRSTATMMFGHIDGPASWANHFEVLREVQRRSGVFTEFVPLPFVHMGAPIWLRGRSRPGPTWDEVVLVHAVARIAFDGLIPNIQASWVKLGLDGGARLLQAGCNDLGGTLMDETITRAAGASHGTEIAPEDFERVIRSIGRTPARRNTLYEVLAMGTA